jgi:hypothetical protein
LLISFLLFCKTMRNNPLFASSQNIGDTLYFPIKISWPKVYGLLFEM